MPFHKNGKLSKFRIYVFPIGPQYIIPTICEPLQLDNSSTIVDAVDFFFIYKDGKPFTKYSVQVAAENNAGIGAYSYPIDVTTLPASN